MRQMDLSLHTILTKKYQPTHVVKCMTKGFQIIMEGLILKIKELVQMSTMNMGK